MSAEPVPETARHLLDPFVAVMGGLAVVGIGGGAIAAKSGAWVYLAASGVLALGAAFLCLVAVVARQRMRRHEERGHHTTGATQATPALGLVGPSMPKEAVKDAR